jgi:hypothetical protein
MVGGPASVAKPATAVGPNATIVSAPAVLAIPKEEAAIESGSFVDEIPQKPEALEIKSEGKPLAFGSLLETPAAESEEETAAYVAPPNPELADRDWAAEEKDEEEDEEESASSSWRRDGGSEDFAPEPVTETAAEKASRSKRRESWTPTREKTQDLLEEATVPEIVAPPAPSMPSVMREVPAQQNSWAMPPVAQPELAEPKSSEVMKAPIIESEVAPPVVTTDPEPISREVGKASEGNSWFSTSSSPWEAEAQKASQLASTWDAPQAPASASSTNGVGEPHAEEPKPELEPEPQVTYDFVSEAPSEEPVHYSPDPGLVQNEIVEHNPLPGLISDGSISPETVETIRQDTIYALESVTPEVHEAPAETTSVKIGETSQHDMDALVANVLAKMSPEMLQAVTREILKPVVAAMIRDEINAKKS